MGVGSEEGVRKGVGVGGGGRVFGKEKFSFINIKYLSGQHFVQVSIVKYFDKYNLYISMLSL